MKFYIKTYGCWLNRGESSVMRDILAEKGFREVECEDEADIIVVNTCAVRVESENRIVAYLKRLYEKYPNKVFIIAGCLAKLRPGKIRNIIPNAILVSPDSIERVFEAVKSGKSYLGYSERRRLPTFRGGITYNIPVQSGCIGKCRFCVGRIVRSRVFSYDPAQIINHIQDAVRKGAKQIYLSGQNLSCYGLDIGLTLTELVRRILSQVNGAYKIRIGMLEFKMLIEREKGLNPFLELFRDQRLYRFIHAPLQSGSDRILELMGRGYKVEEYLDFARKVREEYWDMNITTDIIVAYPGEREDDFEQTINALREIKPDKVNYAAYSMRFGTEAYTYKPLKPEIAKYRVKRLGEVLREVYYERNKMFKHVKGVALVIECQKKYSLVRLWNYKPAILYDENAKVGEFIHVRIYDVDCRRIYVERC